MTYDFTDRLGSIWITSTRTNRNGISLRSLATPAEFDIRHVKIDSYGVMDVSLAYRFLEKWHRLENPTLKVFANNATDKDYVNVSGYEATERTLGRR
ncbi:MAG: hypothetical protein R2860_05605 [Desulfobacterales bacterium]